MSDTTPPPREDLFLTTRWTLVLAAGDNRSPRSEQALSELCSHYWYPLYAYVRRQGKSKEDAEDLVQGFFAQFLQRNSIQGLTEERGKFRAFLLASIKYFIANEWDKRQTQKRGSGVVPLSLDWQSADQRFQLDPADPMNPDRVYEREWALALLERVVARLKGECEGSDRTALFQQARGYLMVGEAQIPYSEAAAAMQMAEGAVRVAVHRLRKRYRELLREEIAQTVNSPNEIQEEIRALQAALF